MNRIKESSFIKGIFYMGFGTIIAQAINVLIQPILTRLVPTETLGIYTYIVSMANIIIPVATLKMEMLIVSEKSDEEAEYITDCCILINIFISVLFTLFIFIGYLNGDNNVFNKYGMAIFWAPVLVLSNGIRFLFISYNNRYKRYKLITGVAILRENVRSIIQVGSGILSGGVHGQLAGYAFSPLLGLQWQMKQYLKRKKERERITKQKLYSIIKKGKFQILYLVPGQFINSFASSIITISITSLFSATTLGHYSAGVRIMEIPMLFITSNVNKVCFQRFSENVLNKKPLVKTMGVLVIGLSLVSFTGFGILYVIAPAISEIVFGEGYYIAGVYIKQLCLMYAVRLVVTSFNGIFTIFEKQKYELLINIALLVIASVAYFVSINKGLSISEYLSFICYGYTMVYVVLLLGYFYICRKYDKQLQVSYE